MPARDAVDRDEFEEIVGMPVWAGIEKKFKRE
jgi:hypothetical protein